MSLSDHLFPDRISPGCLTTYRQRTRILLALYRAGHPIPLWVRNALMAKLPTMVVGGVAR